MKVKSKRKRSTPDKGTFKSNESRKGDSVVYGVLPVIELLRSKSRRVNQIMIASGKQENSIPEIISLAQKRSVVVKKISSDEISRLVGDRANSQGVVALAVPPSYYETGRLIKEVTEKEGSLSVILDGVEDPGNLGAILRTAEGVGIDGVFIPERRAVGLTETVAKSSAGALEYVKVAKVTNVNRLIEELKKENVWVVGTSGDATMDYTEWDWSQSSALVLGGEGKGLHRLTAEKCDVLVKIPMYGKIESLNVSVAAGVILFEAVRHRKKD